MGQCIDFFSEFYVQNTLNFTKRKFIFKQDKNYNNCYIFFAHTYGYVFE